MSGSPSSGRIDPCTVVLKFSSDPQWICIVLGLLFQQLEGCQKDWE